MTWTQVRAYKGHKNAIYVAVSPDGSELATAGYDGVLKVWSLHAVGPPRVIAQDVARMRSACFAPAGELVVGDVDGAVNVWDVRSGHVKRVLQKHKIQVTTLSACQTARLLASSGGDARIHVSNLDTGALVQTLRDELPVDAVAFSGTGKLLATASYSDDVKLWDTTSWRQVGDLIGPTSENIASLACSPDGRTIAGGGWDGLVYVWQLPSGKLVHVLRGHQGGIAAVAFLPDGTTIASGGDFRVLFWDAKSGKQIGTIKTPDREGAIGPGNMVYSLAVTPDGRDIVIGYLDGIAELWHLSR